MSEQNFREIQLTGKQLVFLFMASVVVAVAIFLLGISVGRGVRNPVLDTAAAGTTTVDVAPAHDPAPVPPAVMPPATQVTPADRAYHDTLQGQPAPSASASPAGQTTAASAQANTAAAEPPTPVEDAAPAPSSKTPPAPPPAAPATKTGAKPAVAAAAPATAVASTDTPAPGTGWFVQVGAFKSRDNADHLVERLKTKGYAAFVLATSSATVPFHVRVGPFTDRADAQRSAARLQREEGFKPSVTR